MENKNRNFNKKFSKKDSELLILQSSNLNSNQILDNSADEDDFYSRNNGMFGIIEKIAYRMVLGGIWCPHFVIRDKNNEAYWVPLLDKINIQISNIQRCICCNRIIREETETEKILGKFNINTNENYIEKIIDTTKALPKQALCYDCMEILTNSQKISTCIIENQKFGEKYSYSEKQIKNRNCIKCAQLDDCCKEFCIVLILLGKNLDNWNEYHGYLLTVEKDKISWISYFLGAECVILFHSTTCLNTKYFCCTMIQLLISKINAKRKLFLNEQINTSFQIKNIQNNPNYKFDKFENSNFAQLNKALISKIAGYFAIPLKIIFQEQKEEVQLIVFTDKKPPELPAFWNLLPITSKKGRKKLTKILSLIEEAFMEFLDLNLAENLQLGWKGLHYFIEENSTQISCKYPVHYQSYSNLNLKKLEIISNKIHNFKKYTEGVRKIAFIEGKITRWRGSYLFLDDFFWSEKYIDTIQDKIEKVNQKNHSISIQECIIDLEQFVGHEITIFEPSYLGY